MTRVAGLLALACVPMLAACSTVAPHARAASAVDVRQIVHSSQPRFWHARVLRRGDLLTVVTYHRRLYGITGSGRVLRLDAATGRTLARSRATVDGFDLAFAGGTVWAARSTSSRSSDQIVRLDPASLRTRTSPAISIASGSFGVSLGADRNGDQLVAGSGHRVLRIAPRTARVTQRLTFADEVSGAALTPSGRSLVVTVAHGVSGRIVLVRAGSRRSKRTTVIPGGVVATAGGAAYTESVGNSVQIVFRSFRTWSREQSYAHGIGFSGAGDDVAPTVSRGVLWLGGNGRLACADPTTGRVRASVGLGHGEGARYIDHVTTMGRAAYAMVRDDARTELVRFSPPRSCGVR